MKNYSAFDILGPIMIGPSSSHTAGAVRIGYAARKIAGGNIKSVKFLLHGSFAKTYKGHGTDKALIGGVLGMMPDDERIRDSFEHAKASGIDVCFEEVEFENTHPNTVKIIIALDDGSVKEVVGSSIGGGNILITEINGLSLEFTGEYPTLIVRHIDTPGVIAKVCASLSLYDINIAYMKVFRNKKGDDAFMIVETDMEIEEEVIKYISKIKEVIKVYLINKI